MNENLFPKVGSSLQASPEEVNTGLQTGQKESLKNLSAMQSLDGVRAQRIATSTSPERRSSTLSVPITSRGISGRTFLQRGKRGTSQRLAKAFVVVT
jgi:hypothetical protein